MKGQKKYELRSGPRLFFTEVSKRNLPNEPSTDWVPHVNYNYGSSGQANRPGVREELEAVLAEAEARRAATDNPFEYDEAFEDAVKAHLALDELNQAEFGLELHQAEIAEVGPNMDQAEVENEDGELAYFCAGAKVFDWQLLAAYPGCEIGERLAAQKARHDELEKAWLSELAFVTGDPAFSTGLYGWETQIVGL